MAPQATITDPVADPSSSATSTSTSASTSPSSSAIVVFHPGQPVPSTITTEPLTPEDAVAGTTSQADASESGGGDRNLWLIALLPLFLCAIVAGYYVWARIRRRTETNTPEFDAAIPELYWAESGNGKKGKRGDEEAGVATVVTVEGVATKGDRRRDDDERTLVGKDERGLDMDAREKR